MSRKRGIPNKTTRETKEFLKLIVTNEHPKIEAALADLFESNKSGYLHAIIKLLPFITPKATEIHLSTPNSAMKEPSWFENI